MALFGSLFLFAINGLPILHPEPFFIQFADIGLLNQVEDLSARQVYEKLLEAVQP